MGDFFGHSQFGGQHFIAMPGGGAQPTGSPAYHSGFESLAPGQQVTYTVGSRGKKGYSAITSQPSAGGVIFSNSAPRKRA